MKICKAIADELSQAGHQAQLQALDEFDGDFSQIDKLLIGASIYHGRHNPAVFAFVDKYRQQLESIPNAFFSVNLVARKPEKNTAETNPYMQQFLSKSGWQPSLCSVFGGKINYPSYNFFDRNIIRFIMWMTKGPTNKDAVIEYTDWSKVRDFAHQLARLA